MFGLRKSYYLNIYKNIIHLTIFLNKKQKCPVYLLRVFFLSNTRKHFKYIIDLFDMSIKYITIQNTNNKYSPWKF